MVCASAFTTVGSHWINWPTCGSTSVLANISNQLHRKKPGMAHIFAQNQSTRKSAKMNPHYGRVRRMIFKINTPFPGIIYTSTKSGSNAKLSRAQKVTTNWRWFSPNWRLPFNKKFGVTHEYACQFIQLHFCSRALTHIRKFLFVQNLRRNERQSTKNTLLKTVPRGAFLTSFKEPVWASSNEKEIKLHGVGWKKEENNQPISIDRKEKNVLT